MEEDTVDGQKERVKKEIEGIEKKLSDSDELYKDLSIFCILSHDKFEDPVMIESGFTYEHEEIATWFRTHRIDPQTHDDFGDRRHTYPNKLIKDSVAWVEQQMRDYLVAKKTILEIELEALQQLG